MKWGAHIGMIGALKCDLTIQRATKGVPTDGCHDHRDLDRVVRTREGPSYEAEAGARRRAWRSAQKVTL